MGQLSSGLLRNQVLLAALPRSKENDGVAGIPVRLPAWVAPRWFALAAWALAAAGCSSSPLPRPEQSLKVVTTVMPVTLFTRAVAGECAEITALIPARTSPHDFQARPADLAAVRQARLLIENGLGMEPFLDRLVASAANPQLLRVNTSERVQPLAQATAPAGHAHAHAHAALNPHIWLDPQRAERQVESIRDALVKADPRCAAGYRQRADRYIKALRTLDRELAAQLAPYRGRTIVAFHDIASYFAQRYGLKAAVLVDLPERNPSPADLLRITQVVQRDGVRTLLREPQQGEGAFTALARDLGLRVSVFDPLETGSEQASRNPDTYLQLMRRNGRNLVASWAR